ncbi:MAG: hypothetical protein ACLGH3_02490 [Actinomycetota bacterium]
MKRQRLSVGCLAVVLATTGLAAAASTPSCDGPRQTPDPLSPPCIPTWSGSNGGSTWIGVTSDQIKVVLYNDLGVAGDMNSAWSPTDETVTHFVDTSGQTTNLVRTVKALTAAFNGAFQTYGRTVSIIGVPSALGTSSSCVDRESDIEGAIVEHQPFAIFAAGSDMGCSAARAARAGVPTLGAMDLARQAELGTASTLIHTFSPTIDQLSQAMASFLCGTLSGPARFASGTLAGSPRTLGLIFPSGSPSPLATHAAEIAGLLAPTCGKTLRLARSYRPSQPAELVTAVAEMATAQITTLVCLCPAERDALLAISSASGLLYQPEWVWSPATRMDRAMWQRRTPSLQQRHLGISDLWLAPATQFQHATAMALRGDPTLDPNPRYTTDLYLTLRTGFTGIQMAGPTLTPGSVRLGFESLAPSNAAPGTVQGGFGLPTPNSFTDTFVAWWWDPAGASPGDTASRGCVRYAAEGARYSQTTWPLNDLSLFATGPCTGLLHRSLLDESVLMAVRSAPVSGP